MTMNTSSTEISDWMRQMGVLDKNDLSIRDDNLYQPCKDGVVLCSLANILQSDVRIGIYTNTAFRYKVMENLQMFVQVAKTLLPPEFDCFDASAFYDGYEYEEFLATLRKLGEVTGGINRQKSMRRSSTENFPKDHPPANVLRGNSMKVGSGPSQATSPAGPKSGGPPDRRYRKVTNHTSHNSQGSLKNVVTAAEMAYVQSQNAGPLKSPRPKLAYPGTGPKLGAPAPAPRPLTGGDFHQEDRPKGKPQRRQSSGGGFEDAVYESKATASMDSTNPTKLIKVAKSSSEDRSGLPKLVPASVAAVQSTGYLVPTVTGSEAETQDDFGSDEEVDGEDDEDDEDFAESNGIRKAIALYPYAAGRTDELTFKKGDIIELLTTEDGGWWEGRLGDSFGWFPEPMVQEFEGEQMPLLSDDEEELDIDQSGGEEGTVNLINMRLDVADDQIDPTHRAQVVNDMLSTEYEYITELEDFLSDYASPLRQLKSIPDKSKRAMLGTLIRLVQFQNKFYGDMYNEGVLDSPNMAKIFMQYAEELQSIYVKYHKCHPTSVEIYKRYMDDPQLTELLKSKCTDAKDMSWQIIMPKNLNQPILKMKRYPIVLRDLARTTGNDDPNKPLLLSTVEKYQEIADACQKVHKLKEQERQLFSLDIDGLSTEQIMGLGSLKCYLPVINVSAQPGSPSRERLLLLYPGVVVVLNRVNRNNKLSYKLKEIINLEVLTIKEMEDNEEGEHLFTIHYDKYQQTYAASSLAERDGAVLEIGQARYNVASQATSENPAKKTEKRDSTETRPATSKKGLRGTLKAFMGDSSIMNTKRKDSFKAVPGEKVGNVEIIGKPPVLISSASADFAPVPSVSLASLTKEVREQAQEIQHLKNDVETLKRMISDMMKSRA